MMGITDGRKDFDFNQVITCDECGRYGRYQVYDIHGAVTVLHSVF